MAAVLAKTLKQENADFLAKLMPKMKVIADDAYKHMSHVPFLEWDRELDRDSYTSSMFSTSATPIYLKHKLDLTSVVVHVLRDITGKDKVELFFDDAKRCLNTCFETLFYKSGFTFAVYVDKRPSDMKHDDDDEDTPDKAVILRVALNTA